MEAARQNITTAVEAAALLAPQAGLLVEYDNRRIVDTQTQTDPWVKVVIKYLDGYQADLNENPIHRYEGQIHLAVAVKEGSGSAQAQALLDHFIPLLGRKTWGSVRTRMAKPAPDAKEKGWVYYPILIPFWFDKTE